MSEQKMPDDESVKYSSWTADDQKPDRNYLRDRLEPRMTRQERKDVDERAVALKESSIDYDERGNAEVEHGDVKISISYAPIDLSLPHELVCNMTGNALTSDPVNLMYASDWRVVTDFSITRESEALSLDDILPAGYTVAFKPEGSGYAIRKLDNCHSIMVYGDLTSPGGIMSLLHAAGLVHSEARLSETELGQGVHKKFAQGESLTREEWAILLKSERSAWAYALTKIHPFLSRESSSGWLTRDDARLIAHKIALQQNSDYIREETSLLHHLKRTIDELFGRRG